MNNEKNSVHTEIKGNIALKGWTLKSVVAEMNRRRNFNKEKTTTVSNIANKIKRKTIKFCEVKEIADIIGCELEWKK